MSDNTGTNYLKTIEKSLESQKFSNDFLWDLLFMALESLSTSYYTDPMDVPHHLTGKIMGIREKGFIDAYQEEVLLTMSRTSACCSTKPNYINLDFAQCFEAVKSLRRESNVH
ncbi:hypothetical protein [Spirochaeta cellobiosiphila]|uniref:hypothetical protein n=1 Tax=Spirochaeta cellobiosiphila TaxID=504483 RepID=UPI00041D2C7E|nr:hypothetical protein [Spirochaeta cellobiosiphila]